MGGWASRRTDRAFSTANTLGHLGWLSHLLWEITGSFFSMRYFHHYWEHLFFNGSHCQQESSNIFQNLLGCSPRSADETCLHKEDYEKYLVPRCCFGRGCNKITTYCLATRLDILILQADACYLNIQGAISECLLVLRLYLSVPYRCPRYPTWASRWLCYRRKGKSDIFFP